MVEDTCEPRPSFNDRASFSSTISTNSASYNGSQVTLTTAETGICRDDPPGFETRDNYSLSADMPRIPRTDRSDSVTMSTTSTYDVDNEDHPGSTAKERMKMFRANLTLVSSCIYGVFVVTFGVMIHIQALITDGPTMLVEIFGIYLVLGGLLYFIFLKIDTRRYINRVKSRKILIVEKRTNGDKADENEEKVADDLAHNYCFSTGRHSGSFYLKCGAAVFCFGLLIHSGLLVGYQFVYLRNGVRCGSYSKLIREVLHPIYALFQLYFIFKNSNVIINRFKEFARFGMMHCIATSLCFWAWTILDESMESINAHSADAEDHGPDSVTVSANGHETSEGKYYHRDTNNLTSPLQQSCRSLNSLTVIIETFSPYLYPFTIEYSLLVAGILYITWENIGNCSDDLSDPDDACNREDFVHGRMVIHADCSAASKGLFAGMIVLATSVGSIVLFCVVIADSDYINMGVKVNKAAGTTILLLMIIAAAVAYHRITLLDVNRHPVNQLDDLLLFVCIPAYFVYAVFSIGPAMSNGDSLGIIRVIIQVLQVLFQTPLIMDGLRRCSNTKALRRLRPGKELITFLIICNVAMWITETFQIKGSSVKDYRYDAYGYVMWTLIKHMTVPLQMFYRFHSSVCLVDIWIAAYSRE